MTFDDFKRELEAWFNAQYSPTDAEITITQDGSGLASVSLVCKKPDTPEHPSFLVPWETTESLAWAQSAIERRTQTKAERRQQLLKVDVNEEIGGWIDDFYTDFYVTEEDRECLERFLQSSDVNNRREALLALILATGLAGPKYTQYAIDALILHLLGIVEDKDAEFTGVSLLAELRNRGDKEAESILESLKKNKKWRRLFWA